MAQGSAIEGTLKEQDNKESSSLRLAALPLHGIYCFLMTVVNLPSRSKLA